MSFNRVSSFGSQDSGYETASSQESVSYTASKQQDNTKEVARHRQHLLAQELSRQDSEEYGQDMLDHMLRMDQETMPDVDSIDIQTEIQWFMRPYLLDFLVEAHSAFQLLPETLFLTVNLLDRYCSKRVVYKRHYQLVGCAALLIASKYGDKKEKVPTIKELKSMCCSLYDDDMFLQMEWHVLSTIGWTIGHPTVDNFLRMATRDNVQDPEVDNMALYILEIALYHRDFVSKRSSQLALSALALARNILRRNAARHTEWAATFDATTFQELMLKINEPSQILSRKYASARHSCVSRTLSHVLAQQAAAQAQLTQATAYDLTPPSSLGKPGHYFQSYATPQKPAIPSIVQHGLYTPPITPGEDMFGITQKTFSSNQYVPPTPTEYQQGQYHYQPSHVQPTSHRWTSVDS
ncbi:hypothetical protein LTR64_008570 [Lithohypha guttulata]|uniref:uncharacterized protein n=1 Tax=Lithohypha guttulata TaxID=1690604 RepID=UPI002DDF5FDB|nr:hypothetical protein LTR51_001664 [Lithohypha guttulata]